jgi:hypothetical protein
MAMANERTYYRWSTRRGGDGHTEKAKTRAKKIAFPLIDLSPQNERVLA